jgi:hypothetical protein
MYFASEAVSERHPAKSTIGMAAEQARNLGLDPLRQKRSRAVAQNLAQRIGKSSWWRESEVTAYHSFAGEVEASNTPTIRRLTPSRRHQLSPIAPSGTITKGTNRDFDLDQVAEMGRRLWLKRLRQKKER